MAQVNSFNTVIESSNKSKHLKNIDAINRPLYQLLGGRKVTVLNKDVTQESLVAKTALARFVAVLQIIVSLFLLIVTIPMKLCSKEHKKLMGRVQELENANTKKKEDPKIDKNKPAKKEEKSLTISPPVKEVVSTADFQEKIKGKLTKIVKDSGKEVVLPKIGVINKETVDQHIDQLLEPSVFTKLFKKLSLEIHPDKGGSLKQYQRLVRIKEVVENQTPSLAAPTLRIQEDMNIANERKENKKLQKFCKKLILANRFARPNPVELGEVSLEEGNEEGDAKEVSKLKRTAQKVNEALQSTLNNPVGRAVQAMGAAAAFKLAAKGVALYFGAPVAAGFVGAVGAAQFSKTVYKDYQNEKKEKGKARLFDVAKRNAVGFVADRGLKKAAMAVAGLVLPVDPEIVSMGITGAKAAAKVNVAKSVATAIKEHDLKAFKPALAIKEHSSDDESSSGSVSSDDDDLDNGPIFL